MAPAAFVTADGRPVPAVTAAEMRTVDRIAVEDVGLSLLMMMEHAGRGLAETVEAHAPDGPVAVLAGGGGNSGGGLCAARHLANHGREVDVCLDRDPGGLADAPARQYRVLGDAVPDRSADAPAAVADAAAVVDALVGYSLEGPPRGRVAELVGLLDEWDGTVVSLDVPTGLDATTGERPGASVRPDVTVTLALPKTGLEAVDGELWLADLGIPSRVFLGAGVDYASPFVGDDWRVTLEPAGPG